MSTPKYTWQASVAQMSYPSFLYWPDVAVDVGARRHRLRFERFELTERRGIELVRDDAPQVILEWQFVYDGEGAAAVAKNLQRAAVGARLDFER